VETGVNRQGVVAGEMNAVLEVLAGCPRLILAGLSSHFADVEDTTDHGFALQQMERFQGFFDVVDAAGYPDVARHMSCSASVLLWDRSQRDVARVGISAYGIWPSRETLVALKERGRQEVVLRPAMTWKVGISQVRDVPAGESVGYGRTWQAPADSRIAVLPVGYSDGWLRGFSGRAYVLVRGRRAPVVGRICMNLCMVDVTHIPEAVAGDTAVLLGSQGQETITPAHLAEHLGTIPYEILTLPGSTWTRTSR
jgi:alanine racemase